MNSDHSITIDQPSAYINIGSKFSISIYDKKFTQEEITHIRDFFGFDVVNASELKYSDNLVD